MAYYNNMEDMKIKNIIKEERPEKGSLSMEWRIYLMRNYFQ